MTKKERLELDQKLRLVEEQALRLRARLEQGGLSAQEAALLLEQLEAFSKWDWAGYRGEGEQ